MALLTPGTDGCMWVNTPGRDPPGYGANRIIRNLLRQSIDGWAGTVRMEAIQHESYKQWSPVHLPPVATTEATVRTED